MLVVTRYRVPREEASTFRDQAREALRVIAGQPGWTNGQVGRAMDDPTLWVLTTEWRDVGSYRRALSSYEVKAHAVPLLSRAIDEPTAFEVLTGVDTSARAADADQVGLGDAAAPVVLTDMDRVDPDRVDPDGREARRGDDDRADDDRVDDHWGDNDRADDNRGDASGDRG